MHAEAMRFAARAIAGFLRVQGHVVEIGSRDINGSIRPLLADAAASYTGIDVVAGPGVDQVADGKTFVPAEAPDLVVCLETLEHTPDGQAIVGNAAKMLRKPGGYLLVTCATEPRPPHSAVDGGPLKEGEFYRNVPPSELLEWAKQAGLQVLEWEVHFERGDLYLVAAA